MWISFFIHAASGQKKFTGAIKRNNSLQFMLDFIEKTSMCALKSRKMWSGFITDKIKRAGWCRNH